MMMSEFMNGSEHENNNEQQSDGITPLDLTNGNEGMPQGMNAAADAVQEHGNGNASEHIAPDMAERNSADHAAQSDAGQETVCRIRRRQRAPQRSHRTGPIAIPTGRQMIICRVLMRLTR